MSYLEKLLEGKVVEWKLLKEVAKIKNGKDWKKFDKGDIPVFGSGGIMGYIDTYSYNKPTVLIPRKGSITNIFYVERPFWNVDTIYYTEINLDLIIPKYFYYFMQSIDLMKLDTGSGRPSLTQAILNQIQIPIPPLEIQQKIVGILDSFTELTAREKQYAYYREKLLSYEPQITTDKHGFKVEWKMLGEICLDINAGGDLPKKLNKGQSEPTSEFPYPIYANAVEKKGLYGFTDSYRIESESVTISARGAKIGFHTVREGKYTPIVRLISLIADKNIVNTRYLNYALSITKISGTRGGIPQLTVPTVKKIKIPVPPLEEQKRTVSILDKFDTLINSISEGLPKEIELREKQYEYYRDVLLDFPKEN